ncbi:MAG: hypothetical protein ACP5I1_03635 [Candidatus Hinthialibacter sp.]
MSADADCNCSIPSPLPAQLNGHASAEFSIRFVAPYQPRSFKHIVRVKSENGRQAISIIGNTTKTVETSPRFLSIAISPGVNTFNRAFEIRTLNNKNITASEVKISLSDKKNDIEKPEKTIPGINLALFSLPDNKNSLQGFFQVSRYELNHEMPLQGEIAIRLSVEDGSHRDVRIQFLISEKPDAVVQPSILNCRYNTASHRYEVDTFRIYSTKPVNIKEISIHASLEKVDFEKYSQAFPGLNYFENMIRASITSDSSALNLKYTTLLIMTDSLGDLKVPIIFVETKPVEKENSVGK